jgi:hypothetical protein
MRLWTVAALLVLPLVLAGCSSKPRIASTDPFLTTEAGFKKSVKILAVASMEIPPGLPDTTTVADDFSALIDKQLSRRGYSVHRRLEQGLRGDGRFRDRRLRAEG